MSLENQTREQLILEISRLQGENSRIQERLDRITNITAAIIYILDTEGNFVFINDAVESILNYKPVDLIGRHFSSIMNQDEYERVSRKIVLPRITGIATGPEKAPKLFDERRTGERRTKNLEVRLLTKINHGSRFMVGDVTGIIAVEGAYNSKKIRDVSDRGAGFIGSQGVIFDITRYKKVEKERMELQRRLLETQRMDAVGRLAAKVAHDLNNKLSSIIGCGEILRQDFSSTSKEISLYVDTILSASKHASELSNRLMEFSRKDDEFLAEIDLHELITNVIELLQHTADPSIQIQSSFTTQKAFLQGNPNRIQNAILNLATNACDAMNVNGGSLLFETTIVKIDNEVGVSATYYSPDGAFLKLSIKDTGIGMGEGERKHLFEPFFTTKPIGKGIGLGLASVMDCLKSHGGFVKVTSEKGQGSQFDLYFPLISNTSLSQQVGSSPQSN